MLIDVQFFILDINGSPPPPELQGYNDIVFVPGGMGNVRFIAQFNDHANPTVPYMYHCHMLTHEDMGMMGQFLVVDPIASLESVSNTSKTLLQVVDTMGRECVSHKQIKYCSTNIRMEQRRKYIHGSNLPIQVLRTLQSFQHNLLSKNQLWYKIIENWNSKKPILVLLVRSNIYEKFEIP